MICVAFVILSRRYFVWRVTGVFVLIVLLIAMQGYFGYLFPEVAGRVAYAASGSVIVGVPCDLLFIAGTRYILAWCQRSRHGFECFVLLLGPLVMLIPLGYLPFEVSELLKTVPDREAQFFVGFGVVSNILDFIVCLFLFGLGLLLSLHRLLWPLASRILYAIAPTKVRKSLLVTIGLALLMVAVGGPVPALWEGIIHSL